MPAFRSFLLVHGYLFLFCSIFAAQAGLPVPADPSLLIIGAGAADGLYSFWLSLFVAVTAAVAGDWLWYELGRWRGRPILKLLCRLSFEPDTCVRKTEIGFMKRGAWTLLFAKFVPGMSLISTPLAGAIRMPRWRFLAADILGSALWCLAYLTLGVLFHHQIVELLLLLGLFGRRAGEVFAALVLLFIAWKYGQRRLLRRRLRINRISPAEAHALVVDGKPVTVVDLRSPREIEETGLKIAGARILRPAELRSRSHEIPAAHEVILYCT
jgi:membrane protein DedA with SNARE-associated domain